MFNKLSEWLFTREKREHVLGVKEIEIPTEQQQRNDTNKIISYSHSEDYKAWSEETWAIALDHLDRILDDRTSPQMIEYHRGSLKATLDLLRLSYKARQIRKRLEEQMQDVSSAR